MIACLENIIGIKSVTGLPNPPQNYNLSDSGLFILENSHNKIVKDGCETIQLLEWCDQAKNDAIKETVMMLNKCFKEKHKSRLENWTGLIGRQTVSNRFRKDINDLALRNTYAGLLLSSNGSIDSKARVKRIGLWVNQAGTFTIQIYKNDSRLLDSQGVPVTFDINAAIDVPTYLDIEDLELVFADDFGEYDYSFVYDRGTAQPKNNDLYRCDCSRQGRVDRHKIRSYLEPRGILGDDLNNLDDFNRSYEKSYGILLDVELRCDRQNLICRNYEMNEDWRELLGYVVLYKATANLIQIIIDSRQINSFTLLNKEQLYGKRSKFVKMWEDRIYMHLCSMVDLTLNGCMECQSDIMVGKKTILK